eukprot:2050308-Prymnesium_polylepis.3
MSGQASGPASATATGQATGYPARARDEPLAVHTRRVVESRGACGSGNRVRRIARVDLERSARRVDVVEVQQCFERSRERASRVHLVDVPPLSTRVCASGLCEGSDCAAAIARRRVLRWKRRIAPNRSGWIEAIAEMPIVNARPHDDTWHHRIAPMTCRRVSSASLWFRNAGHTTTPRRRSTADRRSFPMRPSERCPVAPTASLDSSRPTALSSSFLDRCSRSKADSAVA